MKAFAARAVARIVTAYANGCLRTSTFELPEHTRAVLARTWDAGVPTVFVYWHDEFTLNLLLPLHWRAAEVRPEMPACGANDAFGGDVIVSSLSRLGVPLAVLPRRSDRAEKLAALTDAVRAHKRLLLAADYGRPWFQARPTSFQIARATQGRVVAMHVHGQKPWVVKRGEWKLVLPRPFERYELRLAELDEDLAQDDEVLARRLTEALFALRSEEPASLQSEPTPLDEPVVTTAQKAS